jgi:hypothetical protein
VAASRKWGSQNSRVAASSPKGLGMDDWVAASPKGGMAVRNNRLQIRNTKKMEAMKCQKKDSPL